MKSRLTGLLCTSALVFAVMPVHAATVTFNLSTVFSDGAVAPDGPAPYGTVTLDDGDTAGSVQMTVDVSGSVGLADMTELYLNFDPSFDVSNLLFDYYLGSTGPQALNVSTGLDAYKADGDGFYDIWFNFPTADGSTFSGGQTVVYDITSTALITASSFNFLSAPAGGSGPFLAASKWQSTGPDGLDSAWVAAVPVPAAVWLFGSGLLGLVGVARRKKA